MCFEAQTTLRQIAYKMIGGTVRHLRSRDILTSVTLMMQLTLCMVQPLIVILPCTLMLGQPSSKTAGASSRTGQSISENYIYDCETC